MPQSLSLHDYMTVDEIFYFYGKIFGLCESIIEDQKWNLLGILDLKSLKDRKIRNWSIVGILYYACIHQNSRDRVFFCFIVTTYVTKLRIGVWTKVILFSPRRYTELT